MAGGSTSAEAGANWRHGRAHHALWTSMTRAHSPESASGATSRSAAWRSRMQASLRRCTTCESSTSGWECKVNGSDPRVSSLLHPFGLSPATRRLPAGPPCRLTPSRINARALGVPRRIRRAHARASRVFERAHARGARVGARVGACELARARTRPPARLQRGRRARPTAQKFRPPHLAHRIQTCAPHANVRTA
jgi:hypothetical protein